MTRTTGRKNIRKRGRTTSRPRGTRRRDPLVPVKGDRVEATIRLSGLSVRRFAQSIGEKQQTIDLIVQGITKRCRRSRMAKIARRAGGLVTVRWLSGGDFSDQTALALGRPPAIPASGGLPTPGEPPIQPLGVVPPNGYVNLIPKQEPRADLEARRLVRLARRAAERDGLPPVLHYQLEPLLSLDSFRGAVGRTKDGMRIETSEEERARFAAHLAAAIRLVLAPWFRGRQQMEPGTMDKVLAFLTGVLARTNKAVRLPPHLEALVDQAYAEISSQAADASRPGSKRL